MVEAQKSAVFYQTVLSILSLSVFFIPYGNDISLSSLFYIATPYGLVVVLMLLGFLLFNLRLNWLNGASYESSYFLNMIYVPLFFLLNILLDFTQYGSTIIEFYIVQFLISVLITMAVIGTILYLSLRVDQRYSLRRISRENNIAVSLSPFVLLAGITFGIFALEGLIYLITPTNFFYYNSFALIDVLFHFFVAVLFITLYFLADSSFLINIKDRLYLGVGLSVVTIIYSLYFYRFNFNVLFDDFINYSNLIGFEEIFSALYLLIITLGLGFIRYYITRQVYLKQKYYYTTPAKEEVIVSETEQYQEIPDTDETSSNVYDREFESPIIPESNLRTNESFQNNDNGNLGKSKFTGGLLELIAVGIVQWLIIIVTLGIGTPFAIVFKLKWMNSHTYIEGRQLEFTGNALDLIFQWIKWLLLSFITLGIYGFWVGLRMHQWIAKNTVFKSTN
jgi:hypothetical protein